MSSEEYNGGPLAPFYLPMTFDNYVLDPRDPLNTYYSYTCLSSQAYVQSCSDSTVAGTSKYVNKQSLSDYSPSALEMCCPSGTYFGGAGNGCIAGTATGTETVIISPNAYTCNIDGTLNTVICPTSSGTQYECATTIGYNPGHPIDESCGCIYNSLSGAFAGCLAITATNQSNPGGTPLQCLGVMQVAPEGANISPLYMPFSMIPVYGDVASSGSAYLINPGNINPGSGTNGNTSVLTTESVIAAQQAAANYNTWYNTVNNSQCAGSDCISPCVSSTEGNTISCSNTPLPMPSGSSASSYLLPIGYTMSGGIVPFNMLGSSWTYGDSGWSVGAPSNSLPSTTDSSGNLTRDPYGNPYENYYPYYNAKLYPVNTSGSPQESYTAAYGYACPPPYNWQISDISGVISSQCVTPTGNTTDVGGNTNTYTWSTFDVNDATNSGTWCEVGINGSDSNPTLTYSLNQLSTGFYPPGGVWGCNSCGSSMGYCIQDGGVPSCGCNGDLTSGCTANNICSNGTILNVDNCNCVCPTGQMWTSDDGVYSCT